MGKLYALYLRSYNIFGINSASSDPSRKLLISALALRDRQSGKLLTRTEFYAELKRMTAKVPKTSAKRRSPDRASDQPGSAALASAKRFKF